MQLGTTRANETNVLKEKELMIVLIADIGAEKTRGRKNESRKTDCV